MEQRFRFDRGAHQFRDSGEFRNLSALRARLLRGHGNAGIHALHVSASIDQRRIEPDTESYYDTNGNGNGNSNSNSERHVHTYSDGSTEPDRDSNRNRDGHGSA